jgi:hypothetical protein
MWPRILFGGERVAAANPDAIVIDCQARRVHGIGLRPAWRQLPLTQFRFLVAVLTFRGEARGHGEIVDAVWGDDPDGGPLQIYGALVRIAILLNRKLGRIRIAWRDRRGYRAVLA